MTAKLTAIATSTELHQQMQSWRRDIHKHPEIAYEEFRTSDFVTARLRELGLETHTGLGEQAGRHHQGQTPRRQTHWLARQTWMPYP